MLVLLLLTIHFLQVRTPSHSCMFLPTRCLTLGIQSALAAVLVMTGPPVPPSLVQLLLTGGVSKAPPVSSASDAELKRVDVQEGYQLELAPGSAISCLVSFAPQQERRVFFAGKKGFLVHIQTTIEKISDQESGVLFHLVVVLTAGGAGRMALLLWRTGVKGCSRT